MSYFEAGVIAATLLAPFVGIGLAEFAWRKWLRYPSKRAFL